MKRSNWPELTALGLVLAFAVVLARGWPDLGVKGWEAAAAIAAAVSSMVALWVAGGENRRRKEERSMKADVLLEVVRPELEALIRDMARAVILLESMLNMFAVDYQASAGRLRALARNMELEVVRSERAEFPVLPADKAVALGRLLGNVPRLSSILDGLGQAGHASLPHVLVVAPFDVGAIVCAAAKDADCVLGTVEPEIMRQLTETRIGVLWSNRLRQIAAERREADADG